MTTSKMIRIGAVSYINSLPLFSGFQQGSIPLTGSLTYDVPARLNAALRAHTLDLSLISSAEYLAHEEMYTLVTDCCVSADGPVMSVLLYSKIPLEALSGKTIAVTAQSASSVLLLKVLCYHFWHLTPHFVTIKDITEAKQYEAFLLIGDECLAHQTVPGFYTVDLAEAWRTVTGLPFTFALFAAHRGSMLDEQKAEAIALFSERLKDSLSWAEQNASVIEEMASSRCALPLHTLRHYYTLLGYRLDDRARAGLQAFKQLAADV